MLDEIGFPDPKYGDKNKEKYYEITSNSWSPFYNYHYWEVYIFAMSYAYAKGEKPKQPVGSLNLPAKVFQMPTRDLMRALAIDHTKNLDVIKNSKEVVKICEGFAYVGFDLIMKKLNEYKEGDHTEDILMDLIKEISQI
jgi:hypothetical protein